MVSLVVSAFARPWALRTCLSSLAEQTHKSWEAVVVDNTPQRRLSCTNKRVVEQLAHGVMRYMDVSHETYMGETANASGHKYDLYKATELGVAATSGEWLGFPNDDTYMCPWYLERMLKAAVENSWELVYCDLVAGTANGHWPMQVRPQRCCIDKTCFLVRREWFKGFDHSPEAYPMADGLLVEDLVARGIRHGRVSQTMVVHN